MIHYGIAEMLVMTDSQIHIARVLPHSLDGWQWTDWCAKILHILTENTEGFPIMARFTTFKRTTLITDSSDAKIGAATEQDGSLLTDSFVYLMQQREGILSNRNKIWLHSVRWYEANTGRCSSSTSLLTQS